MAMNPLRTIATHVARGITAAAPVAPVTAAGTGAAGSGRDDAERTRHLHSPKHGHAHAGHAGWHGPAPRPRKNATAKSNRSRRRKRAGSVEDDELELPECEDHDTGIAKVCMADSNADSGDDQDEGGEERSRQDRLAWVRQMSGQLDGKQDGVPETPVRRRGTDTRRAVERFVQASRAAVASARPGDRVGQTLQREKLRLLETTPANKRLDTGGLARVVEHLQGGMKGGSNPLLNLMLPILLLQLQLRRTPEQLDEAIARLQLLLQGAGK